MNQESYFKNRTTESFYLDTTIHTDSTQKSTLGKFLRKIIKNKPTAVTRESAAEHLGITDLMLKKKLYHRDASRDWIIAICAAFGLNARQTNAALHHYDYPGLDKNSSRDSLIETCLNEHDQDPVPLTALNDMLISMGMIPLKIQKRTAVAADKRIPHYKQHSNIHLRITEYDLHKFISLKTEYLPSRNVVASMVVEDPDGLLYALYYSTKTNALSYHELEEDESGALRYREPYFLFRKRSSVDHPGFGPFFLTLINAAKSRKQQYDDILNDSRNYQGRFSADIKDGSLHAFYEIYNYNFPQDHEYYLMEYLRGKYSLSVSHKSMFMQEYLTEDQYFEHYHIKDRIGRKTYSSVEEIDSMLQADDIDLAKKNILIDRKNTFLELQQVLESKIADIMQKKLFIRNGDAILNHPEDVLRFFDIEDIFKCEYDSEAGPEKICSHLDEVLIAEGTEDEVKLTFNDIWTAFECGFECFDDICKFKRTHASISDVLK